MASLRGAKRPRSRKPTLRVVKARYGKTLGGHCRKKSNISTVLAGQKLGIKEVDDGIWLVSFMHYDLGYIDLEQRTLQTIDNPFGTRLSPMS